MPKEWRCFHCDEVFTDREAARKHFGNISTATPRCVIDKCLCHKCTCTHEECRGVDDIRNRHREQD